MTEQILVVNDDGIHSKGISVLKNIAKLLSDNVSVVAPDTEQSASSHSLTLHRPLRIRSISENTFSIDGTPTDCVFLAYNKILKDNLPTLVLSGINRGINVGEDITYSGTVAAAIEATLLKIPAIALSQEYSNTSQIFWETSEEWAPLVIEYLLAINWEPETLFNINFPNLPPDEIKGVVFTEQGKHEALDLFEQRVDPRGREYFWIGVSERSMGNGSKGTDVRAINDGYISVTPLHLNLTHYKTLQRFEGNPLLFK
tara:strand:- start:24536 stop:25306 length:771 start_codon:yes stop_codon:yes gene_type:complete